MEAMGNHVTQREVKQALLDSMREGTEEGNKRRKELGVPALHVTGWFEEPHYEAASHNLVWALSAQDDNGEKVVNYNMRVLGREGYMSITQAEVLCALESRCWPDRRRLAPCWSTR